MGFSVSPGVRRLSVPSDRLSVCQSVSLSVCQSVSRSGARGGGGGGGPRALHGATSTPHACWQASRASGGNRLPRARETHSHNALTDRQHAHTHTYIDTHTHIDTQTHPHTRTRLNTLNTLQYLRWNVIRNSTQTIISNGQWGRHGLQTQFGEN